MSVLWWERCIAREGQFLVSKVSGGETKHFLHLCFFLCLFFSLSISLSLKYIHMPTFGSYFLFNLTVFYLEQKIFFSFFKIFNKETNFSTPTIGANLIVFILLSQLFLHPSCEKHISTHLIFKNFIELN